MYGLRNEPPTRARAPAVPGRERSREAPGVAAAEEPTPPRGDDRPQLPPPAVSTARARALPGRAVAADPGRAVADPGRAVAAEPGRSDSIDGRGAPSPPASARLSKSGTSGGVGEHAASRPSTRPRDDAFLPPPPPPSERDLRFAFCDSCTSERSEASSESFFEMSTCISCESACAISSSSCRSAARCTAASASACSRRIAVFDWFDRARWTKSSPVWWTRDCSVSSVSSRSSIAVASSCCDASSSSSVVSRRRYSFSSPPPPRPASSVVSASCASSAFRSADTSASVSSTTSTRARPASASSRRSARSRAS